MKKNKQNHVHITNLQNQHHVEEKNMKNEHLVDRNNLKKSTPCGQTESENLRPGV